MRYHTTAQGNIPYTAEEELARDAEELANNKASLLGRIDNERDRRFYSNIDAVFPAGTKTIQFRNERDRANFTNVVQGAMALVIAGNPAANVEFITADNAIQTLTSQQMMTLGLSAMSAKQGIIQTGRAKKDAVLLLTTQAEIDTYDPLAGW